MREISVIIILIYRKLGVVGPGQQTIKLPSPDKILSYIATNVYGCFAPILQNTCE